MLKTALKVELLGIKPVCHVGLGHLDKLNDGASYSPKSLLPVTAELENTTSVSLFLSRRGKNVLVCLCWMEYVICPQQPSCSAN